MLLCLQKLPVDGDANRFGRLAYWHYYTNGSDAWEFVLGFV